MPSQLASKSGADLGAVRAALPLDHLVPYLEKNIEAFKGPVEVRQFNVRVNSKELNETFANITVPVTINYQFGQVSNVSQNYMPRLKVEGNLC